MIHPLFWQIVLATLKWKTMKSNVLYSSIRKLPKRWEGSRYPYWYKRDSTKAEPQYRNWMGYCNQLYSSGFLQDVSDTNGTCRIAISDRLSYNIDFLNEAWRIWLPQSPPLSCRLSTETTSPYTDRITMMCPYALSPTRTSRACGFAIHRSWKFHPSHPIFTLPL